MAAWIAPPVERSEPARVSPEREALEAWLDFHRATLLHKCAGLTAEQLAERSVPPSRLSMLGLVRHMTDVERWWFRMHAGEEQIDLRFGDTNADFEDLDPARAEGDLEAYRQEIDAARAAVRAKLLDDRVPSRGHYPEQLRDIR